MKFLRGLRLGFCRSNIVIYAYVKQGSCFDYIPGEKFKLLYRGPIKGHLISNKVAPNFRKFDQSINFLVPLAFSARTGHSITMPRGV